MRILNTIKDGFRGKPDFSETLSNSFQIDDLLLSFECPNNIYSGRIYKDVIDLKAFDDECEVRDHEQLIRLAYVHFCFHKVILNPIFPINLQGELFIRLRIRKAGVTINTAEELSCFLEKDYFEFYHDPNPSEDSMRGYHTEYMNDFRTRANRRWGEEPETEERKKEKEDFLIGAFLRGYPPIKCETVKIGRNIYSKYIEGNLKYKREYRRIYNLPIKNEFFLCIEFKYIRENYHRDKKLISWIQTADETLEKRVLERLDISPLIDSVVEPNVEKLTSESRLR